MDSYRIMVIDDEKIAGNMAKLSLELDGYMVETFLNAGPALDRLKAQKFDVVVTDLVMTGIDGVEVLRTVNKLYPETRVIIMTAFANIDAVLSTLKAEIHDCFLKPVKIRELKESIHRALEKG
jgi:DNA-binding NtrC family response regulator